MGFQVTCNTTNESLLAKMATEHSNNGTTLPITDIIKDLIYLKSIPDRDLNGVRSPQRVETEGFLVTLGLNNGQDQLNT
jgi:hypothetical protein